MRNRKLIAVLGCMALVPLAAGAQDVQGPPPGANERWAAHDTDGDGAISLAEAEAGAPGIARNFARFDADGDGLVTRAEMHTVRSAEREQRQAQAEERYRKADTNGDGVIDPGEAQAGMPKVAERFGQIDSDASGTLTREELRSAMRVHRAERMQGQGGARKGATGAGQGQRNGGG